MACRCTARMGAGVLPRFSYLFFFSHVYLLWLAHEKKRAPWQGEDKLRPRDALMMIFTEQDRSGVVTLSTCAPLSVNSAKGLARWALRCFPFTAFRASAHALSMTIFAHPY
jgi:hypothetical protein